MMLTVLLLAGAEKLINMAISSDDITQAGLAPLVGQVLRLNMALPKLQIDIFFNHEHIRFEPVSTSHLFEAQGHANDERTQARNDRARLGKSLPDCTLNIERPSQLIHLMRNSEGNLPITGDYKILMNLKQLVAGFDPDIAGQLELMIGKPLACQLQLLISQLKRSFGKNTNYTLTEMSDWANNVISKGVRNADDKAQSDELKQQLLKLRADVEREDARLQALKAEQTRLTDHQ